MLVRSARTLALAALLAVGLPAIPGGAAPDAPAATDAPGSLQLVGNNALNMRGMNAALAVHGNYAYVGSRVDGKPGTSTTHLNLNGAGILVVDISNPAQPNVVHQIGPPDQGLTGQSSREMRIWPQEDLLIVENLYSNCAEIHACTPVESADLFTFYDISGANAAAPKKLAEYESSSDPHEFFLWVDPFVPGRALLFISAAGARRLIITEVTRNDQGALAFKELASWAVSVPGTTQLHSMGVSNDGTRTYLALLTNGFVVADTSDFAANRPAPKVRLVTPAANRPTWPGTGIHSAVKVPGRPYILATDETYGEALAALGHGCPWGWSRMIDIADPTKPQVIAEYKLPQNEESFCTTDPPRPFTSISSHNPTLTPNVALITWHSGGFQVVSLEDPTKPTQLAQYLPTPLPVVLQEDPVLSSGADKVVMWSYPVIKDGLIYVVDVRNGLYVLRYTGPFEDEISSVAFLEGNSNLGDALRFEPVDPCLNPTPPPECPTG